MDMPRRAWMSAVDICQHHPATAIYADDCVVAARTETDLQNILDAFAES